MPGDLFYVLYQLPSWDKKDRGVNRGPYSKVNQNSSMSSAGAGAGALAGALAGAEFCS